MAILHLEEHVGVAIASHDAHRSLKLLLHVERISPFFRGDLLDFDDSLWPVQVDGVKLGRIPSDAVIQVLIIIFKVHQRFVIDALPVYGVDGQMRHASVLFILFLGLVLGHHGSWAWVRVKFLLVSLSRPLDRSRLVKKLTGDEVVGHHRCVEAA